MGDIGEEEEKKQIFGSFTGKRQPCRSASPLNLMVWVNRTQQLCPDSNSLAVLGHGPSRENPSLPAIGTRMTDRTSPQVLLLQLCPPRPGPSDPDASLIQPSIAWMAPPGWPTSLVGARDTRRVLFLRGIESCKKPKILGYMVD